MKRFSAVLLIFCLLIGNLPMEVLAAGTLNRAGQDPDAPEYSLSETSGLPEVAAFDYEFLPPGEMWKTVAGKEAPAKFTKVDYVLADGVVELNQTVANDIASAGQLLEGTTQQNRRPEQIIAEGGYIRREVLNTALAKVGRKAEVGTVVVDSQAGTAFKISSSTAFSNAYGDPTLDKQAQALSDTYMLELPQLDEVFQDFSLGGPTGEKVDLTMGNIGGFAPNVEDCVVKDGKYVTTAFGDAVKDFTHIQDDRLIELKFTNTELTAGSGNDQIKITLSGGLAISNIEVDAKYSKFKGYHLIMTVSEEFYLVAELKAQLHQEARIPLFGIDIPFGIGRVSGGLYLVLGVDGNIRIEADAREYASLKMGIKGGTKFGIPTSVKGVFEKEFIKEGDVDIAGQINGYVKVGPLLDISLLGMDLVGAGALAGVGLNVSKDDTILDIELFASLQVYFKIIGKTKNLINWKPTLLRKRQFDSGGYKVTIQEAYIKIGRVGGYLEDTHKEGSPRVPGGVEYRILVYPVGVDPLTADPSKIRYYPQDGWRKTTEEGEFFYEETDGLLHEGEMAAIEFKIQGNPTPFRSTAVPAVFPFDKVTISEADYFNDVVTGNIAPVKTINYDAQQVGKPGDPADPPEAQWSYIHYANSPLHLLGKSGVFMMNEQQEVSYNAWSLGSDTLVITDGAGNFDSRNPSMGADGAYEPVYNGTLQIVPGARVLGPEEFDYSKNKTVTSVLVSFNEYSSTGGCTIYVSPILPLTFSRTLTPVEGSQMSYAEGEKFVNRVEYDETLYISNGGGTRAVTPEEITQFSAEGWTTQDIAGTWGGKFIQSNETEPVLTETVGGSAMKVLPVLDEQGNQTSSVMVQHRVKAQWVWQEHPLPTRITSAAQAQLAAGQQFKPQGRGIWPLLWSLEGAPQGITINPATGAIQVEADVPEDTYTFTIQLEQDPVYFAKEASQVPPLANQSFGFGFNKTDLDAIHDFSAKNANNPAMATEGPLHFIGHAPAPPARQELTLTVTGKAPNIRRADHNYHFNLTQGQKPLSVKLLATGSPPITWSLTPYKDTDLSPSIAIAAESGLLTTSPDLAPGTYYFTAKATNSYGSDTQDCQLNVSAAGKAPTIRSAEHNYHFNLTQGQEPLSVKLLANGSQPITWSLVKYKDNELSPAIRIAAQSGLLTTSPDLAPGTYYFTVKATNSFGRDTQDCQLNVSAAGKAPTIPRAEHSYRFSLIQGQEPLSVKLLANGTAPITWSLVKYQDNELSPAIRIAAQSGLLTSSPDLAPGTYYFTVKATNSFGSDTQDCILSVSPARKAPVIAEAKHNYVFEKLISSSDLVVPIEATGSRPIQWSLEAKSPRIPIPQGVRIDPDTGVLTISRGIAAGEYPFLIRAENSQGSDTQECLLKVLTLSIRTWGSRLSAPLSKKATFVLLAVNPGITPQQPPAIEPFSTTIRADHVFDRYTYDRTQVDGTEFIRWDSVIRLNIENSPEELIISPQAKICDSYHIYIDMTDPALKDIVTDRGKRIQDIIDAKDQLGKYLLEQFNQYRINPWTESWQLPGLLEGDIPLDFAGLSIQGEKTLLSYGETLTAIAETGDSSHSVELGGSHGTSVTGEYFVALAQNPGDSIAFKQEGAVITFLGKDVENASKEAMYYFGFNPSAQHGEQMKAALSQGSEAFVYSFLGHGALPGTATFAVTTNFAEGSTVNVYRFNDASGGLELIAKDVAVAAEGVVTYRNASLSEYLVTPQRIAGAQVSEVEEKQAVSDTPWLFIVLGILGVGLVGAVLGIALRGKNKTKTKGDA